MTDTCPRRDDEAGPPKLYLDYQPRPQFRAFHLRLQRFACIVAHRRAGKTLACVHDLQDHAIHCTRERPRFAYIAPYLHQAKTVAWDHLRAIAAPIREGMKISESELRIDYQKSGGQVRLYGADNPDALRGIYLDGVVLDEYADMDPRVWPEVIRPALAERGGFAVFIGTPKGRNGFHALWQQAQDDPDWFTLMLRASETGLLPEAELASIQRSQTEEQHAQEFECSFDAAIVGAFYGKQLAEAARTGRIGTVPHEPSAPVWTAWDLGIRDATAIWFAQTVGREIRIIDYYEASGVDLGHYVRELVNRRYVYGGHIMPHDARAKELGTGKSRWEVLESLGLRNLTQAPDHRVEDGINAVRMLIPRCWFDAGKCERGIEALKLYRSEFDDRLQALKPRPVHDWSSHAADAFRYLAMRLDSAEPARPPKNFNRRIEYPNMGYA
jgi:phage terminase large subunit